MPKAPLLTTGWLGRPCLRHDQLASTNDMAAQLAKGGAAHGTVVVADCQTVGRGRLGRSWYSPKGVNIYLSAVLRPNLSAQEAPLLSLAAAVGLAHGMGECVGRPPCVKWPNDLLYDGRKVAGILLEKPACANYVILGAGVNVNGTTFPEQVRAATSLRLERGAAVCRAALLALLLGQLETWIDRLEAEGAGPVLDKWSKLAPWLGQTIHVRQSSETLHGVALGLAPNGALRLRAADGRVREVLAGDVHLGEP